jgi:hypothetical protein
METGMAEIPGLLRLVPFLHTPYIVGVILFCPSVVELNKVEKKVWEGLIAYLFNSTQAA